MKMSDLKACCSVAVVVLVFLIGAQGQQILYAFDTNPGDPWNPMSSGIIAQGRDGNLYSTAPLGGANGCGAIFKITPTGTLSVLWSFDCTGDVYSPMSGLTLGTDGNLYGTTSSECFGLGCFPTGYGTIFKISPTGKDYTTLYSFNSTDGSFPVAPPIQGWDGAFYGTTPQGGKFNSGTVYRFTPSSFTTLYSFGASATDGVGPSAPLVQGTDGNFYGTTSGGGSATCGCGTVFKITPQGKLTILYSFDGILAEDPVAALIEGNDGNFYGTTYGNANATSCANGQCGTVFKITPPGQLTILHSFMSEDGLFVAAGLAMGSDGNLYGVTQRAAFNLSILFHLSLQGAFSAAGSLGTNPNASVTPLQHTSGILYGDTTYGGNGYGEFYSLDIGLKKFAALLPSAAKVGKVVQILGQGFKNTTAVSFNGNPAQYQVHSNTFLTATVPAGATTGRVTVTLTKGKLVSKQNFQVLP